MQAGLPLLPSPLPQRVSCLLGLLYGSLSFRQIGEHALHDSCLLCGIVVTFVRGLETRLNWLLLGGRLATRLGSSDPATLIHHVPLEVASSLRDQSNVGSC